MYLHIYAHTCTIFNQEKLRRRIKNEKASLVKKNCEIRVVISHHCILLNVQSRDLNSFIRGVLQLRFIRCILEQCLVYTPIDPNGNPRH